MSQAVLHIAGRVVGGGAPCLLIAEVAQAHDGSLGFAHSFIDLAREVGADAIKFQTHIADAETTPLEPFRVAFSYEDATRFDYWRRMEFRPEQWAGLAEHAKAAGLMFLSSPFSIEALHLLQRIGVPAWKVASGELSNIPLLDAMVATGKPLLLSSGMSSLGDLEACAADLRTRDLDFGVFQCTTKYPTPLEEVGLNLLPILQQRLSCPVGLSDHSGSPFPALAAMAQGAAMIEVHLAFHRRQFGPDTAASLVPEDFALLRRARDAFHILASHPVDKDAMAQALVGMGQLFGKSVALKAPQAKGTVLTRDMLTTKKPGTGLPPGRIDDLVGRALARDMSTSELLSEVRSGLTALRLLCLICAREGSKGIVGKNIRPLAGKPLIAWTIAVARQIPSASRIVVSTDGEQIAQIARQHSADVPFCDRRSWRAMTRCRSMPSVMPCSSWRQPVTAMTRSCCCSRQCRCAVLRMWRDASP